MRSRRVSLLAAVILGMAMILTAVILRRRAPSGLSVEDP